MSRTYRRTQFNKKSRPFFGPSYTSRQEVERMYSHIQNIGCMQKNEAYKYFSDSYMGVDKGSRQLHKNLSYRELRQQFRVAERNLISGKEQEKDIVLKQLKPRDKK